MRLVDIALPITEDGWPSLPSGHGESEDERLAYGHYRVCRTEDGAPWELGRGSMGITYKAIDNNLGCTVALKVINPERFSGPRARERLLREARAAATLRHPNIAAIFHLGQDADRCFYAMEFIEGETLAAHLLRQGAMPPVVALNVVLQAARALQAAHARGFTHRDIKPTNLMLPTSETGDGEFTAKLIDFGLVKAAEQKNEDAVSHAYFAGTPHYASPEQLRHGVADARSDIYSLGRCLRHMLTGSAPTEFSLPEEASVSHPTDAPRRATLSGFHKPVVALVDSMTAEDPALRPQTASDLIERIQSCLQRLKTGGETFAAWRPWNARHVWLTAGLLTLVGLAGWFGLPWARPMRPLPVGSTDDLAAKSCYFEAEEAYNKRTSEDNSRAIDLYTRATQISPTFADAYAGLALAYYQTVYRLGRHAENIDLAIRHAQRAIMLAPESPKGYRVMGDICSSQGRPWQSLAYLHKALEKDPNYLPVIHDFGLMWVWVGRPQWCLPWVEEALRKEPSDVGNWYIAAEAHTEVGADEQAEADYRRYLEINPNRVEAYCGLAHLSTLHEDYAKAREFCALALAVNKTSLYPLTLRAQVAFFSGDHAAAETDYRALIKLDRGGLVTYHGGISYLSALGVLRCQAGDRTEGEALLEEAANLRSQDAEGPQTIYDLAGIRAAQGRKEEALALLRQAISSGWIDGRSTRLDPRFAILREEPAFQSLLTGLRARSLAACKEAERLCAKPLNIADYPVQPGAE